LKRLPYEHELFCHLLNEMLQNEIMKHTGVDPLAQILLYHGAKIVHSSKTKLKDTVIRNSISLLLQSPLFALPSKVEEASIGIINPESLSKSLNSLMISADFSDVAFRLEDDKIVHAHKVVVSRCPYLYSIISNGMKESHQELISLKDISSDVFLSLLHYLYTDTLSEQSQNHIMELLSTSNLYLIDNLKATCEVEIAKALTLENVDEVFCYCQLHNAPKLQQECMIFVKQNSIRLQQWNIKLSEPLQLEVTQIIKDRKSMIDHLTLEPKRVGDFAVTLKTLTGKTVAIENVTDKMSVEEFRNIVEIELELEEVRLIHTGKQLEDERILADYNITKDSTVFAVIRLRGA